MRFIYLTIFLASVRIAFGQTDCSKYTDTYIPENLNDAINYLGCVWGDKETFKNKSERDAVADAHFAWGQRIRNDWELWKGKNSLYREFRSLGVTFPEDISSIIQTSFHRTLNNKDVNLEEQLEVYRESEERMELVKLQRNRLAKTLKVGDRVNVVFSRNQATKDRFSLALLSYGSTLDKATNCVVAGRVMEKRKVKGSCILKIEITDTTNCDNSYFEDKLIKPGQIFSYNMTYFNLSEGMK